MLQDRKDTLIWLIPTVAVIIFIPLLAFILVSTLARGVYIDSYKTAFTIGSIPVAWYGIFIFFGFVAAIFIIVWKMWRYYQIPIDPFYWYALMAIPGAILGARFWSCTIGDASWGSFWSFRDGGLAIEGGVICDVLIAFLWFPNILKRPKYQVRDLGQEPPRVRRVSMWVYVDCAIPAIFIGQILGRYGNYMNQELYGPIGCPGFLQSLFPWMNVEGQWHQPLFFYEGLANWVGLALLFVGFEFIPGKKSGDMGIGYFLWYGIVRVCMEPFRDHKYTFTTTYVMTGFWIGGAVILLILNHTLISSLREWKCWAFVWAKITRTFQTTGQFKRTPDETLYYLGR